MDDESVGLASTELVSALVLLQGRHGHRVGGRKRRVRPQHVPARQVVLAGRRGRHRDQVVRTADGGGPAGRQQHPVVVGSVGHL